MTLPAVEFDATGDQLHLIYRPRDGAEWVYRKFRENGTLVIKGTFHLTQQNLVGDIADQIDFVDAGDIDAVQMDKGSHEMEMFIGEGLTFVVAKKNGDYFHFDPEVVPVGRPILLFAQANPTWKWFSTERNISILGVIAELRPSRIVIGGEEPDGIPIVEYEQLIEQFPTPHELKRYVQARVAAVVRQYTDASLDAERLLHSYVNKRSKLKGKDLAAPFRKADIAKYEFLLERLNQMLESEDGYPESAWQAEILQVIRLLNPKYIAALKEARVRDSDAGKWRKLDVLLVDASGNVDVIEIKRPFSNSIVTTSRYRDNHVPLRELSGAVMQIEKYIRHLNRWGTEGETGLGKQFKKQLPDDFQIKITNPYGIIIMGRDNRLSADQKHDFEVVRRHYKHIADIVTYDDLIRRLEAVLDQLRSKV